MGTVNYQPGLVVEREEVPELKSPQREAAFFFGLFLRGHSADTLRKDIEFPVELLDKWLRHKGPERPTPEDLQRVFEYRRQVLAIFNFLVDSELSGPM